MAPQAGRMWALGGEGIGGVKAYESSVTHRCALVPVGRMIKLGHDGGEKKTSTLIPYVPPEAPLSSD